MTSKWDNMLRDVQGALDVIAENQEAAGRLRAALQAVGPNYRTAWEQMGADLEAALSRANASRRLIADLAGEAQSQIHKLLKRPKFSEPAQVASLLDDLEQSVRNLKRAEIDAGACGTQIDYRRLREAEKAAADTRERVETELVGLLAR